MGEKKKKTKIMEKKKERGLQVRSPGWEDPLEKVMATHSRVLAWRILWREETPGLQSIGSQRNRNDWSAYVYIYIYIPSLSSLPPPPIPPLSSSQSTTLGYLGYTAASRYLFYTCTYTLSCVHLCKPMGCSLPGSSVHGILQARIPEWVAMPSSRGSS